MKWEYRKLGLEAASCWDASGRSADDCVSELNRLAREGWEITRIIPLAEGCGLTHSIIFLLRRERVRHATPAGSAATWRGIPAGQ